MALGAAFRTQRQLSNWLLFASTPFFKGGMLFVYEAAQLLASLDF